MVAQLGFLVGLVSYVVHASENLATTLCDINTTCKKTSCFTLVWCPLKYVYLQFEPVRSKAGNNSRDATELQKLPLVKPLGFFRSPKLPVDEGKGRES